MTADCTLLNRDCWGNGQATDESAQALVATDDLVDALFQNIDVESACQSKRGRNVIGKALRL
jgi:hypothetical protein